MNTDQDAVAEARGFNILVKATNGWAAWQIVMSFCVIIAKAFATVLAVVNISESNKLLFGALVWQ